MSAVEGLQTNITAVIHVQQGDVNTVRAIVAAVAASGFPLAIGNLVRGVGVGASTPLPPFPPVHIHTHTQPPSHGPVRLYVTHRQLTSWSVATIDLPP